MPRNLKPAVRIRPNARSDAQLVHEYFTRRLPKRKFASDRPIPTRTGELSSEIVNQRLLPYFWYTGCIANKRHDAKLSLSASCKIAVRRVMVPRLAWL